MPSWALPWLYSGCNRRLRSLRDFCARLRDPFRFVVQCQIGLRDDANQILATACALSLSTQQTGSRLMISLIFMGRLLGSVRRLCLLYDLDLVDDLSIPSIGLRDKQREVVLLFAVDCARQNHRVLINVNSDIAVAEHGFRIQTLLNSLLYFRSG